MKKATSAAWFVATALAALARSEPVSAGEPARSMAALEERIEPGTQVDVVDRQGRIVRGVFARADDEGVLVTPYGSDEGRKVPAGDVMSVTRAGDSLKNGALIGAAVGLLSGIAVTSYEDPYSYSPPLCETSGCKLGMTAFLVGTYAGVGALIDRAIKGHEVVYRAPAGRLSWSVTPHTVPRGAGIQLALKF